jgi:hypothetical protein
MIVKSLNYTTGRTLKTVLRDFSTGVELLWNTTLNSGNGGFEVYNASNIANYGITTTEGTTGPYIWTVPAALAAVAVGFEYQATTYDCAASTLATSDLTSSIWLSTFGWDGSIENISKRVSLASTGLDAISITAPTGPATTFAQMIVQLWRRFFKLSTLTSTQLKTYADDGTTVLTTQAVSETNTTQTQGST